MSFLGLIIERCGGDPLRSQTETKSSVVRHPTLRGEFHFMIMKTIFGKIMFFIERRISLYDRNYVLRLVFFITTFFAGKWDLQGRVPTKSLEHPYML